MAAVSPLTADSAKAPIAWDELPQPKPLSGKTFRAVVELYIAISATEASGCVERLQCGAGLL